MRYLLICVGVVLALLVDLAACQAQGPLELPAGKKLISLEGHLWQARWSQDGKTIVTSTHRNPKDEKDNTHVRFKTAELWDAGTGKRLNSLGELEIPNYPFLYLSANADRLVISQGFFLSTGEMEVWDTKRMNIQHRITVERRAGRPLECIAVSPKGEFIADLYGDGIGAAAKGTGGIDVYECATGKKVQTLREEKCLPRTAVFARDGQSIITRGSKDVIRLWNTKSGKLVREAQASLGSGGELALSPDGKRLVIPTTKHEALQIWSVPELKALPTITNPFHTIMRVQFSPSGKRLLIAGFRDQSRNKGEIKLGVMVWDVETSKLLHDWNTQSVQCGFCGEDHLGVGERNAIMCYPIGAAVKKTGQ
jgi:predicted small lipoprotein YifL